MWFAYSGMRLSTTCHRMEAPESQACRFWKNKGRADPPCQPCLCPAEPYRLQPSRAPSLYSSVKQEAGPLCQVHQRCTHKALRILQGKKMQVQLCWELFSLHIKPWVIALSHAVLN